MSRKTGIVKLWRMLRSVDTDIAKRAVAYMSDPDSWLIQALKGQPSSTGISVTERESLQLASVYSAVTVLSKILASLPIIMYRRLERGKERAIEHPLYQLLHLRPNPEQTAFGWKEVTMAHLTLWQDAYSEIVRGGDGWAKELWPIPPWEIEVTRRKNGELRYVHTSKSQDKARELRPDQVLHIPGFTLNGIQGVNITKYQQDTIGLGLAADRFGSRFFANDASAGGFLVTPGKLSQPAKQRLKESWEGLHSGDNQHRVAVLEDGLDWKGSTVPPDKAQFLETRKHQVTEIARIFDLPPHMIGDLERATFDNIEHQGLEFLIFKLGPWLTRIEQNLTVQLLQPRDWNTYLFEFLVDALLRGDVETRFTAYRTGREIGVWSINDVREMENRNPIDDPAGDDHHIPLNWVKVGEEAAPTEGFRELRSRRSADTRSRIAQSYRNVIADAMGSVVRREINDLRKAVDDRLRDQTDFDIWLRDYYEKLPEWIKRRIKPAFNGLSEAVALEIADEMNSDPFDIDQKLFNDYLDGYISRYVGSSQGQLTRLMDQSVEDGTNAAELIDTRLDEWLEKRAGKEGMRESVRASNAFAQAAYASLGIILFKWFAIGADTCPYCQQMNGQTVSVGGAFALPDTSVGGDGDALPVKKRVTHPPIHDGCVCQIGPA